MKLRQILTAIRFFGITIAQQSATTTSYDLLDIISEAEAGLSAVGSALLAESSRIAASRASEASAAGYPVSMSSPAPSSYDLGGLISLAAPSSNPASTSQNPTQSSTRASQSRASISTSQPSRTTLSTSASSSSSSQSETSSSLSTSSTTISQTSPTRPATSSLSSSSSSSLSSTSTSSSSASSSASASSNDDGDGSDNHTLTIVLSTVFGVLFVALVVLAVISYMNRRRNGRRRLLSGRASTPESDEVDSWRRGTGSEMRYAQVPPEPPQSPPTAATFPGHTRSFSHEQPLIPRDPSHESEAENPFNPTPSPPRRGAPNARPGLTDDSRPGDEPFVGAAEMTRSRSRSLSSGRLRRSVSHQRLAPPPSIVVDSSALTGPGSNPQNIIHDPQGAATVAVGGSNASTNRINPSKPGDSQPSSSPHPPLPKRVAFADPSVNQTPSSISRSNSPDSIMETWRMTQMPDYDPETSQLPPRRSMHPRPPKRVSFALPGLGRSPNRLSRTSSTDSVMETWRITQLPTFLDFAAQSDPSAPRTRDSRGYSPIDQSEDGGHERSEHGAGNGNNGGRGRRLRLGDLTQAQERDWYLRNHEDGYDVGTAM